MEDVLLISDTEQFQLSDLFKQPQLAQGLNRVELAPALQHTPKSAYSKIKEVAAIRFGHEMPEFKKLSCMGTVA